MADPMDAIERAVAAVTDPRDDAQTAAAVRAVSPAMVDDVVFGVASSAQRPPSAGELLGVGMAASPGSGTGRVVASAAEALERWEAGDEVVLVVDETSPADEPALRVAAAVVTRRGGVTSHAAIVARQWGVPAVCGIGALIIETGAVLRVDGSTGEVRRLDGAPAPALGDEPPGRPLRQLPPSLDRLLRWADTIGVHGVAVYGNADRVEDAELVREFGAFGVGLCRTEHQFLGERAAIVERVIAGEADAIADLVAVQRAELAGIFAAVGIELPVHVRLLDAPRHEFDPQHTEHNPMLGLRGVRLAIRHRAVIEAQAEAIAHAMCDSVTDEGLVPAVGVVVPMVALASELEWARAVIDDAVFRVSIERGVAMQVEVGTMIETPRAALCASSLANHSDFFAFGTNDLTQLTYGFSRDDVEAALLPTYRELGLMERNPFETLDGSGVVRLMALAAETGRAQRPDLQLGLCGEHGGDPDSIAIAIQLGLSHVSVSPYRIPAARMAAAHAVLRTSGAGGTG